MLVICSDTPKQSWSAIHFTVSMACNGDSGQRGTPCLEGSHKSWWVETGTFLPPEFWAVQGSKSNKDPLVCVCSTSPLALCFFPGHFIVCSSCYCGTSFSPTETLVSSHFSDQFANTAQSMQGACWAATAAVNVTREKQTNLKDWKHYHGKKMSYWCHKVRSWENKTKGLEAYFPLPIHPLPPRKKKKKKGLNNLSAFKVT